MYMYTHMQPPPLEEVTETTITAIDDVINEEGTPSNEPPPAVEDFPVSNLTRLDEQLGRPKWVVPVRPDDDLERLLLASIKLCREGECGCVSVCVCVCVCECVCVCVCVE